MNTGKETNYQTIKACRVCGSGELEIIHEFGAQPLANSLKKRQNDDEAAFPLTLQFCHGCSLVQLKDTVAKEIMFKKYLWCTATSATTIAYIHRLCARVLDLTNLRQDDLIIELASNDGTFLKQFLNKGYQNILGVDPAKNIADMANAEGIRTIAEFWNDQTAQSIYGTFGKAKLIIARNVIPHVSELHEVIQGIELVLQEDGTGIIEFHDAGQIIQELHYDSIYHEHLCYFSLKSIEKLLSLYKFHIYHVDQSPISGGSYVVYFTKNSRKETENSLNYFEKEKSVMIDHVRPWQEFAKAVVVHKQKSRSLISSCRTRRIIGFGASARSSTYLNYCGFDSGNIKAIIDNNALKQGLYTPGSSIPIVSFPDGMSLQPEIIFILAWNFKDEIIKLCTDNGYNGRYLIPFPHMPCLVES